MNQHGSQKPTASSPYRSFFSRALPRREKSSDASKDLKGPLGLNTLYEPPSPAITDLVFVHGLGGGSQSTWTRSGDTTLYWPQTWLPYDNGFRDVRIHSFGYNSNWETESILNIHDFAKSLLGSIQDCPAIPRDSNVPIVLVGHSMGGLVIKRAYILARQKEEFVSVSQRIRTIVFLATPHRGADLAQLLTKILNLSSGARPFVTDLHRNSLATQSINDEFPQHCQDLQLYSFYETLPTSYKVGKTLIVDKDSATLGYVNERTAYLNANHRDVCKYASPTDPNYKTVRNALASAIDAFRSSAVTSHRELDNEHRKLLDSFLAVSDAPEDDFMDFNAVRTTGSCEWLLKKTSFQEWQDSPNIHMYWISAKPATGKTILSGKIVHHLKDFNRDVAFYFFDYRSKEKTAISSFLLSMAWQMAYIHTGVLGTVLGICEKDGQLCKADYRTLWRKLFMEGIIRMKFARPQYWVIDALDECRSHAELVPLLLKVVEVCNIRVLLTSRDRFESYRQVGLSKAKVVAQEISADDTRSDITLYLEANMDRLPSIDEEARQDIVTKILTKSAGCFLWVSLILQELSRVHTFAEIRQVLDEVPNNMNELYSRILDSMSCAPYGKDLAKAILTWTVCSARPLTTEELHHAIQIDMKDSIDSVERSIATNCGHLVYIDGQSRVQMVHQTARDFLLRGNSDSEFAIDGKVGHTRLALCCLRYLNSKEMKGPRHRNSSMSGALKSRCPFVAYASDSLFEHISHASSTDNDVLSALARFLDSSNVLSWIEYLAQHSNLNRLIQTGKAFRNFQQRRSKHLSPLGKEITLLDSWATDLVRLVTKFGKNLSALPSSIFHLIPPFCPSDTAPCKGFAASTRGITVHGLSATTWDDCLSTIVDATEQFSALTCSDNYFAIGMSSGKVVIYDEMTCQETHTLQHHEPVRMLQLGCRTDLLISSGARSVRVWDMLSWKELWTFDIPQICMSLWLMEEEQLLLGALRNNRLTIWDLGTGTLRDSVDWTQDTQSEFSHAFRRPIAAAFGIESRLLAVVYRGQDILLWDLEGDSLHDTYCKEYGARSLGEKSRAQPGATGVVFSAAPNMTLLAATYSDGDLVLFDTSDGTVRALMLANAQTLASSPDGRTLACGNSSGIIQLYDFDTLRLLYCINSEEYAIKQLAFSGDSHRLLDIRGSQCRVWDPTVLVRQDVDDENSDTIAVSTAPQEISVQSPEDVILITSLACSDNADYFFCGKEDGAIYLYETKSGRQMNRLLSHAHGVSILSIDFNSESKILCSTDSSSRVMAHRLSQHQHEWQAAEAWFDYRVGIAVDQVLSNRRSTRLLVSTAKKDELWSISSDGSMAVNSIFRENQYAYRWSCHPSFEEQLILIVNNIIHLYDWQTLRRLTGEEGILLEGSILPELCIRSIVPCFHDTVIATAFSESRGPRTKSKLLLWNTSDFSVESKTAAPVPKYHSLADKVKTLIGSDGHRLVFLEDNSWISSTNPQITSVEGFVRHFFLPADWLSTNSELIIQVTCKGSIIFVKRDEVAIIERGLASSEQGFENVPGKRISLLGGMRPSTRARSRSPLDTL
ncbi:MAG: hypothetical protein M1835_006168 [Candelina submexicana]|nr:MAG: hypothetical protein M1835_006168 [Candelina submexicana]